MSMTYDQITTTQPLIRDGILDYLRANQEQLIIPQPGHWMGADRHWRQQMQHFGVLLSSALDTIFDELLKSGRAQIAKVQTNDSSIVHAFNSYNVLAVRLLILEELQDLVRLGVLTGLALEEKPHQSLAYNYIPQISNEKILLTQFGVRFINNENAVPFFADSYLARLRQICEPGPELTAYLVEGLSCLRHQLARAGAMILRLATEHTLNQLIDSTKGALSEPELGKFTGKIRNASIKIEERIEVVLGHLTSNQDLVPKNLRDRVAHQLKASYHSIRELGGRAAHNDQDILTDEVAGHYMIYANLVYPTTMNIIQHHQSKP